MPTSRKTETLAIAFVKIKHGAILFETLGDERACEQIGEYVALIRAQIAAHQGNEIKTITGDTVMCSFADVDAALLASVGIQERVMAKGGVAGISDLSVAVGFAFGPMLIEKGDAYGHTVHIAARLAAAAKGGQIVTNAETAEVLSRRHRAMTRLIDHMPVKGISEPIDLHEVVWEEEGITSVARQVLARTPKKVRLHLRCAGAELTLDHTSAPIVLGRGSDADLLVAEADASRIHLRIEHRRGKFIATDQSVNGSYVETGQSVVRLRRNEAVALAGAGRISLGCELDFAKEIIEFELED